MKSTLVLLCRASLLALASLSCLAAPLDFHRAVELAAQHSAAVEIASADQERARAAYLELRDMYLPQLVVGSGLGYTAGFPLSMEGAAPSIFNVTSRQFLINPAQRWLVRSAHELVTIENERVQGGVDNPVLLTRAKLDEARTRMRSAELEGTAMLLRKQLSDLTGLPTQEIEPVADSLPPLPDNIAVDVSSEAMTSSEKVKFADEQARASSLRAAGEHRQNWPTVDFVSQYALLSKFNNYEEFYKAFQRNNLTVGVSIRFPFLNPSQSARAKQADADALKARRQADNVRSQVATEAVKLQTTVRQLTAARDVAQYDYELARADTSSAEANIQAGKGTLTDEMAARVAEQQKFDALLDATFQLRKAQIELLRSTGELENWALAKK